MKYQKRRQYKYAKPRYRVRNWVEYEGGLRSRGDLLPLRQTEGFLRSLARMLEVELPIPNHTTLSRRLKKLSETPFAQPWAADRAICSSIAQA